MHLKYGIEKYHDIEILSSKENTKSIISFFLNCTKITKKWGVGGWGVIDQVFKLLVKMLNFHTKYG